MTSLSLRIESENWPLRKPFRISRETMTHVAFVAVTVTDGTYEGRGEGCPVPYFGESMETVTAQIESVRARLEAGEGWDTIHDRMPAGSARNALDCAIWDFRAKQVGRPVADLLGLGAPRPLETVYTISLDQPDIMARAAREASGHNILKLKVGAAGDLERLRAIRDAVPDKRLIIDANEGWDMNFLREAMPVLADLRVEMVEQPLPRGQDDGLRLLDHLVPIGADESCHTTDDLDRVSGLYDVINIKLDKTGGLTEAMRLAHAGRDRGLEIMVGCMLGTSLAMAPGMMVGQLARFVDLDAPLLIGDDRSPGLVYDGGIISPPEPALWG